METRSLLRQIPVIGYGMSFGVLILLAVTVHVDGQVSATWPVGSTSFTPMPGLSSERVGTELATSLSPGKPSAVPLSQSTTAAKKLSLKATTEETTLQDSSTDEHETASNNISGTHPSTSSAISLTTESPVVGQRFPISPTTQAAVVGQKSGTTSGTANPLNTTAALPKTADGISSGLKPRSNSKQTTKGEARPTPEQDVLDDTKSTDNHTHLTTAPRPSTTTAAPQTSSTVLGPRASPEKKSQTGIIVAAVLCALLLLVLLVAVLLCRRRRRSGSTSFNEGWAGQAALADDLALDRDVEQGVTAPAKEEEAKRNTLITFSGKRQSRVPSVAMEEIGEKGEKEENRKLLCGDAGGGSSPEASGQANGKFPESTMQPSQEAIFPPPPANQD